MFGARYLWNVQYISSKWTNITYLWLLKYCKIRSFYYMFYIHIKFYFDYMFHICYMYVIFFKYCYTFLFSYYLVLNLCNNVFIFIIYKKLLWCKILLIKEYLHFSDLNFLFFIIYIKFFIIRFLHGIRLLKSGHQFVYKTL